ncbi:MAG: divalent metal cation transporter, partial [Cyclobacteriaceae bacterium]|nr:divalent metal cation transporter [Cyclobacteriaceae bacterium]
RQMNLAYALRTEYHHPLIKTGASLLVFLAIWLGNGAYQSGNLLGAAIGLQQLAGQTDVPVHYFVWGTAMAVFILLFIGKYQVVEKVLIGLVALMSTVFLVTIFFLSLDFTALLKGLVPSLPSGSTFMAIGLIGTTIVPYNLFMHSATVSAKWSGADKLPLVRRDVFISISIGGIISLCVLLTAASTLFLSGVKAQGLAELGEQLRPLLGDFATGFLSCGVFAAGLTSSITAPLAAGYAIAGLWKNELPDLRSGWFRGAWMSILASGLVIASLGIRPLFVIQVAQFTNGLLLPILAVFLLVIMNSKKMGENRNGILSNVLGILIVMIVAGLGLKSIVTSLGLL